MKIDLTKNTIICGDNLEWMKHIPSESIDLCYIDPPFFSNANYEIVWGNGYEVRSFGDRFSGGISHYIEWMKPRIQEIHRVLKRTGSIFLHCDWHASHRLRLLLEDVFGEGRFQSEIVWKRTSAHNGSNTFGNVHDTIFFFSKGDTPNFNKVMKNYDSAHIARRFKYKDPDGRLFSSENLTGGGPGPARKFGDRKISPPPGRHWAFDQEGIDKLMSEDRIHWTRNNTPRFKKYLDESEGKSLQSVWDDIPPINSQANERLGYPTQKPEALISRIIECSTNVGDIVLDCFGGGGTTAKVAGVSKRKFITGDVSPVAVKIMAQRLQAECNEVEFDLKGLYKTADEFKTLDGHVFADLVCEVTGWKSSDRKSGDKGIDAFDGAGNPIQIKNHKTATGRPDLHKFLGALQGSKKKFGHFVAWDFSRDAKEFVAELKQDKAGVEIQLLYCAEIFGPLLISDEKRQEIELHYTERFPQKWKGVVTPTSKDESLKAKTKKAITESKAKKKKKKGA